MIISSTPSLNEFDPTIIKSQIETINEVRSWDYAQYGILELLLSGSVGSAKSLNMAHIGCVHCIANPGAVLLLGRRAMPDLKDTIFKKIKQHLYNSVFFDEEGNEVILKEGVHYKVNNSTANIKFLFNGSEIIARSWGDKNYTKFRSIECSAALVEELTENDSEEFEAFYPELKARVGRIPHIKESFIISATNPDGPSHSAYDYFIGNPGKNRKVIYSVTSDNPFLPKTYIDGLLETFTKDEAERMVYGRWLDLRSDVIYYAYNPSKSDRTTYIVNELYPITLTFDFNIGIGKPMSAVAFQYINGEYHFFKEFVVKGARTKDIIEEAQEWGLFEMATHYLIRGDASGKNRSTNYNKSDYEVIEECLKNMVNQYGQLQYKFDVPVANPSVRTRHVTVNGLLESAKGVTKIFIYDECPTLREGLKKSKLKKGSSYIEDEKPYQHITTALGYGVMAQVNENSTRETHVYKAR
jgi:hypothetical protein